MNCLARCAESKAPLCCLGDFLEKLQAMGWSPDDLRLVETAVLRFLGYIRETDVSQSHRRLEADSLSAARSA
jgi:hypothetical protein